MACERCVEAAGCGLDEFKLGVQGLEWYMRPRGSLEKSLKVVAFGASQKVSVTLVPIG